MLTWNQRSGWNGNADKWPWRSRVLMIRTGMRGIIELIRKHLKIRRILRCESPYFHHWSKYEFLGVYYGADFLIITRSHGSVTIVVRATRQVSGRRQTYPSHHTHTPQPTVAKYCTRDYVHDISPQAKFGQDRPGVTSTHIAKVTTYFFKFLCTQNLSTDLELKPLNRFWHAIHQQTRIHAG